MLCRPQGRWILGMFGVFSRVSSKCIFFYIQVIFHGQVALIIKLSCFKYLVTFILVPSARGFCKKRRHSMTVLLREMCFTIRYFFPCFHVSRDQSNSRNKIFEKSHPESNPVGFSRQKSVGNIDKLAMLAYTSPNVHEHHQAWKHLKIGNEICEKTLLLFVLLGPCAWIPTYISVFSKENGYMSTSIG